MDRKAGITLLSLIMWLNAINVFSGIVYSLEAVTNLEIVVSILLSICGVIAGITAYALWTLKPWAYKGIVILIIFSLITNVFSHMPEEANEFHWAGWLILLLVNIVFFHYLLQYVKNNTTNYSNN